MEQSRSYLSNTNLSVKEISYRLGYDDSAYFTRFFTTNAGVSPTEFRRLSARSST
ncbi:helix-turn-helix domain-containing protein [Mesorhizobium argentiipisi]|uniref:helix-turn-helix domain-containing protein n=1 Tax=Mesorhizobium argentiipisi TaxID=3015175 RepID=UPI0039F63C4B